MAPIPRADPGRDPGVARDAGPADACHLRWQFPSAAATAYGRW